MKTTSSPKIAALKTPQLKPFSMERAIQSASNTTVSLGRISKVIGLTLESTGPPVSIGDVVAVYKEGQQQNAKCSAEVVGFRDNRLLLMPLSRVEGVACGDLVERISSSLSVPVGPEMVGRVVDALGNAADGKGEPEPEGWASCRAQAPDSMTRQRIAARFRTGVRAIDGIMPCGYGQRVNIIGGSGVGKSTLLGMIARNSGADINVIGLIGERGREVREFVEDVLGPEGMEKSIVVAVTSDKPAMQRVKGPETAMAIAEYFRDKGLNVSLILDSLTRYAMGQREIGLAAGEPPTSKGYPPSVFKMLPEFLERAGSNEKGTITGFFTILVESDDVDDTIADTTRALTDGHIVLSRDLGRKGVYPPIDILSSVSRVDKEVATGDELEAGRRFRELYATYEKYSDMIAIGAYQKGADETIDRAIDLKPTLDAFISQKLDEFVSPEETFAQLQEIIAT